MSRSTSPLVALLTRLTRLDGVVAAALSTADGLPIASAGDAGQAPLAELRSATTAAIFGAVNRALPGLGLGNVHAAKIETTVYAVYLRGLGDLVLSAVVERRAPGAGVECELDRVVTILNSLNRPPKGN